MLPSVDVYISELTRNWYLFLIINKRRERMYWEGSGNGKAIPLQAWAGPEGSRRSRLPFQDIQHMKLVRLSALRTGRLYPQEMFLVLISGRG